MLYNFFSFSSSPGWLSPLPAVWLFLAPPPHTVSKSWNIQRIKRNKSVCHKKIPMILNEHYVYNMQVSTALLLLSHEAHVAFGFPTLFRLKPATRKQRKKGKWPPVCKHAAVAGERGWLDSQQKRPHGDRVVVPPSFLLLPSIRRLIRFLFLLASHKVAALDRLSDINTQLFSRRRQRRDPLEIRQRQPSYCLNTV